MLQQGILRPTVLRTPRIVYLRLRNETRGKSITAAIERGRSAGDVTFDRFRPARRQQYPEASFSQRRDGWQSDDSYVNRPRRSYRQDDHSGETRRSQYTFRPNNRGDYSERGQNRELHAVESLPYTTAASEFIYGYSSVLAAVKANRRKYYTLYVHSRGSAHAGKDALVKRARTLGIETKYVGDEYLQALDKASSGRPHNVCIQRTLAARMY